MTSTSKKLAFTLLAVALTAGFLEGFLALASMVSPRVDGALGMGQSEPRMLDDPRLGHRPNPDFPGGDERGYRNPAVPATAAIVALGDSQTFGTGVGMNDTWPQQLARMTGGSVYNFAYPGYGPAHCLLLMDEALAFKPATIVATFYAGNDLFDSFNIAYNVRSLPEYRNTDPAISGAVESAEAADPIAERVTRLFSATSNEQADTFVTRHSRLYGIWRRLGKELARRSASADGEDRRWAAVEKLARENPRYCELFDNGEFRTAFTPEYRLSALDLTDPRLAEGERISLEALLAMHRRATQAGVRFIAVLIPTKELVFEPIVTRPSENMRKMLENETRLWATTQQYLSEAGVDYVDALPALRGTFRTGAQPYPQSQDGHPNPIGHAAIAAAVFERLGAGAPAGD